MPLLDLLLPPACVGCRVAPAWPLCPACRRALPWLGPGCCPRCALPRHVGGGCPALTLAFDAAWAPVAYAGVARELVLALKRRGALALASIMAAQIVAGLPAGWAAVPLVAVPPARARRRARGFDAAAVLAAQVALRTGAPLLDRKLERRDGRTQQRAGRAARRAHGRIAVRVRGSPPRRVLLIDDVQTTGATLGACAAALKAAGASEVLAATYARTP